MSPHGRAVPLSYHRGHHAWRTRCQQHLFRQQIAKKLAELPQTPSVPAARDAGSHLPGRLLSAHRGLPAMGGEGSPFTPLLFLSLPFPALPFPSRPFSAPFPAEGRPQPAAGWRQLPASWCHRYLVVTSAAGAGPCCMALAAALFPGQPRSPGGCDGNPRRMFAGGRFWCKRRAGEESREGGEKGGPEP